MTPTLQFSIHLLDRLYSRIVSRFRQILTILHRWRRDLSHAPTAKTLNERDAIDRTFADPKTSVSYDSLAYLASGKSSVVYTIDEGRVLKEFHDDCGRSAVELLAYNRLGSHPNIARLLGIGNNNSLILERGEVLRTICRAPADKVPMQKKLVWLKQAATGYQHVHSCGIVHGDVGTHNMIVMRDGCVKLIDFEGCSVDGKLADSCYEWFSYCPSVPSVTPQTDIFAFGCAMYEIETCLPPFHDLEKREDAGRVVEQRYSHHIFPDIEHLLLCDLIRRCWQGKVSTMSEVVQELEHLDH